MIHSANRVNTIESKGTRIEQLIGRGGVNSALTLIRESIRLTELHSYRARVKLAKGTVLFPSHSPLQLATYSLWEKASNLSKVFWCMSAIVRVSFILSLSPFLSRWWSVLLMHWSNSSAYSRNCWQSCLKVLTLASDLSSWAGTGSKQLKCFIIISLYLALSTGDGSLLRGIL